MSDQPLVASVDTAVIPAPGYYPDPSVPGFVRYWNGGAWVPGTSRPAPKEGEVLEVPRFAARTNLPPSARYIPPPVVPAEVVETGPVFLDQTTAGTTFTVGPEVAAESAWRADPLAQRGLLETGTAPRWVSWGVAGEPAVEPLAVEQVAAEPVAAAVVEPVPVVEPVVAAVAVPAVVPVSTRMPAPAPVTVPQKSAGPTSRPAARRHGSAPASPRPAGLARRLVARLLDSALLAAVAVATALPLLPGVLADVQHRIQRAHTVSLLTGREVQVWLLDPLVLGRLAVLLGVLLLAGFLLDVLPTARTGRTLGKRAAGLRVVAVDGRRSPTLGRALVRWLVRQLSVLTIVGVLPVLFDRRRRGWQDRAAGTRVVES